MIASRTACAEPRVADRQRRRSRLAFAVAIGVLAGAAGADTAAFGPPRIAGPDPGGEAGGRDCIHTGAADSCSRVLACIGDEGLWFRGRATGWNRGALSGAMSDGTACSGEWGRGGWFGLRLDATLVCADGRGGTFRYVAQDPATGTGIAQGRMGDGARVTAWTGENVLDYLTPEGERHALLPCGGTFIPIS